MKKWLLRTFYGALVLGAVCIVSIQVFLPAAAAYACPGCYGLREVHPRVFVEASASEAEIDDLLVALNEAERRLVEFYGTRDFEPPYLLVCATSDCDRRLGGKGAKANSYGATFIQVSPDGWSSNILAHELAHIEFHGRIGEESLLSNTLPAWFDEGLAVIVSQDERYLRYDETGDLSCNEAEFAVLPTTNSEWGRQAGQGDVEIYAHAACRVAKWLEARGGKHAIVNLVYDIQLGRQFTE